MSLGRINTVLSAVALFTSIGSHAQVVINEVDYDQVGTDNAEFLEIKNVGASPFPLQYLAVVFINGNNGGAEEYRTIQSASWPALAPGDYFVICANQGLTLNCDHAANPATNLIQNGSPDAIVLRSSLDGTVYDVLSYGGSVPGHVEGTGTTVEDSNLQDGLSLCRWPDGADTDDNAADFVIGCPTPGTANVIDPVTCAITTGLQLTIGQELLAVVSVAYAHRIDLQFQARSTVPLAVSVFAANGALVASRDFGPTASVNWSIPVNGGQLYLVQARMGQELITRRVMVP